MLMHMLILPIYTLHVFFADALVADAYVASSVRDSVAYVSFLLLLLRFISFHTSVAYSFVGLLFFFLHFFSFLRVTSSSVSYAHFPARHVFLLIFPLFF